MKPTKEGYWSERLRAGKGEQLRVTVAVNDETEARARFERLRTMSQALTAKGLTDEAACLIRRAAARPDRAGFDLLVDMGRELAPEPVPAGRWNTFRDLWKSWVSGELHQIYPDHVRAKKTSARDAGRLEALDPFIGKVPLRAFRLEHALNAMRNLPATSKRPAARRHYAQVIAKVLRYAVFPCQVIEASPLPKGFLPKIPKGDILFPHLYPAEDLALLRCKLVDLPLRILFGLINREGMRTEEALSLEWERLDRNNGVNGIINVGTRKNGRPGTWPAAEGTLDGLWVLRDGTSRGPFEALANDGKYAERLRAALQTAGVDRPELFASGDGRRCLRAHDLRATAITLWLSQDKSEGWIMRRTGHSSSKQIHEYDHAADDWTEHGFGDLLPLDLALGLERETAPAAGSSHPGESKGETNDEPVAVGSGPKSRADSSSSPSRIRTGKPLPARDFKAHFEAQDEQSRELSVRSPVAAEHANVRDDSPDPGGVRQKSEGSPDPLLASLESAAADAVRAHDWTTVAAIGQLIDKRVQALAAAAPPKVTSLADARKRRDEGGGK
jgi:integrase